MNMNSHFEVHHNAQDASKIRITEVQEGVQQVLSDNDFARRFKHLQRKEKEQQSIKIWETEMNTSHKTNFKGTLLLMLEEKDGN